MTMSEKSWHEKSEAEREATMQNVRDAFERIKDTGERPRMSDGVRAFREKYCGGADGWGDIRLEILDRWAAEMDTMEQELCETRRTLGVVEPNARYLRTENDR